MNTLDPLRFPLRGLQLVEASAGTGKTWTISALYLRLVLGHGDAEAGSGRPLDPPQVAVVTFTEAATQELRDRIRERLSQAAAVFASAAVEGTEDGFLLALRDAYPAAEWPACAHRLQAAAEWMDQAAIHTIHGWCQRMLREHAFDSGSLFAQTLQADRSELLQEAVRDWWRTHVYALPVHDAARLATWWEQPSQLAEDIGAVLAQPAELPTGREPAQALAELGALLAAIKQPWAVWLAELERELDAAVAARQLVGAGLSHRGGWFDKLRAWVHGVEVEPPLSPAAWQRLSRAGLDECARGGFRFEHPAIDDLASLRERIAALPDARPHVLFHAAHWVRARMDQEQARRAEIGFDELLSQLSHALHGQAGPALAERIRMQFPVALIDEFQDTDPLQWGIFRSVYPDVEVHAKQALILIGDPKQAIYSFRGADLHTYLAAKRSAGADGWTLGTNFRSSAGMVEAVNHLFRHAEGRAGGRGAFMFGEAGGNPLPFHAVRARGRERQWVVDGSAAPALTCWRFGEKRSIASACAGEIVRLLRLGQQGRAGFLHEGALRPVRPGDIAVLVNNRHEAREVRGALFAAGVRSVYLSDADSVFQSDAAAQVQRLLAACAEPGDERLVRAALATGLLGLSWAEIAALDEDESRWEALSARFARYHAQWRRQGVLAMLRKLLHDHEVPARLLARGDERLLTDLLHIAELLQHAQALVQGEHALVRHLAAQRARTGGAPPDEQIVRLESDAALLKVVTVHKSKGLEYPLVFLPYGGYARPVTARDTPVRWHDEQGRMRVSVSPAAEDVARADLERRAEDVRKLYVALTRARYATWIGVAADDRLEGSALGWLLGGEGAPDGAHLDAALQDLARECEHIDVVAEPAGSAERFAAEEAAADLAPEPPLPRRRERWWVASYSRLEHGTGAGPQANPPPAVEGAAAETWSEGVEEASSASPVNASGTLHDFPRGATPGSFLHGLLEWAGREGYAQAAADRQRLARMVAQRCRVRGWSAWAPVLSQWLMDWLHSPLPMPLLDPRVRGGDDAAMPANAGMQSGVRPVDMLHTQVEMEFWIATERVSVRDIDALVTRHTLHAAPRPPLLAQQLNGMFKGYIDLVFEHAGRWWVVDFKSNTLGTSDADYTHDAMRAEVLRRRYELQYVLYLYALHRHLRARLPDYDYDRHVGGALYLFLRGHASQTRGVHAQRPPARLMDELDALFARREAA